MSAPLVVRSVPAVCPPTTDDNDARRFAYLLALPVPVCDTEQCPLFSIMSKNAILENWWTARKELADALLDVQRDTLKAVTWPTNTNELFAEIARKLQEVLVQAQLVQCNWEIIYSAITFAGSSARFPGLFVPTWNTPMATMAHELSEEIDDNSNNRPAILAVKRAPLAMRRHCEVSFVFENCALALLMCCCKQQLATLTHVRGGADSLPQTAILLREALAQCNMITTRLLPMHYPLRNGTESFLLSQHFYSSFVRPLIEAQLAHVTATHLSSKDKTAYRLHSIAELICAARLLKQAGRTNYSTLELPQLALHRHASALLLLGTMLFEEAKSTPTAAAASSSSPTPPLSIHFAVGDGDPHTLPPHSLMVEALACVRIAALLLGRRFANVVSMLQAIASAAQSFPSVYVSLVQTDVDAALSDAEMAGAWRRSVQLSIADSYSAHNTIVCGHRATRSPTVNLDAQRLYTIYVTPPPKMSPEATSPAPPK